MRTFKEIWDEVKRTPFWNGKKLRQLHRELKENYGEGLDFLQRYPNLALYISILALGIAILRALLGL